ncbi:hypothetical protein ACLOJK_007913, partial [Asimina triloba]
MSVVYRPSSTIRLRVACEPLPPPDARCDALATATARPKPLHVGSTLAHRRGRGTITAAHADDQHR